MRDIGSQVQCSKDTEYKLIFKENGNSLPIRHNCHSKPMRKICCKNKHGTQNRLSVGVMKDTTDSQNEPHPVYDAPGCGLASYSCLLFLFFLVGLVGIIGSLVSIISEELQVKPFFLVKGNQVQVWRLQPMRDAKLLGLTEVPLYYHDESQNGTQACALSETGLLRLDGSQAWSIPYSDIESTKIIYEKKRQVAVTKTLSGETLPCFFGPSEGSERFRRFLMEQQTKEE